MRISNLAGHKGLADLEELALSCYSEQSGQILLEAISCYSAGSYRAAITMSWVAVVYDIVEKCRQMAIAGHGGAKKTIDEFEARQALLENQSDLGAIKKSLDFERNALRFAKDELQLLDQTQFSDLERLHIDRNKCAHPSYQKIDQIFQPNAELARLHIRNLVDHLLRHPPIQGRFILERVKANINSEHFPTDKDGVANALLISGLVRPSQSVIRDLCHFCLTGLLEAGKRYDWNTRSKLMAVLGHLKTIEPNLLDEIIPEIFNRLVHAKSDEEILQTTITTLQYETLVDCLDDHNIGRMRSLVRRSSIAEETYLFDLSLMRPCVAEAAKRKFQYADVADLVSFLEWDTMFGYDDSYTPPTAIGNRMASIFGSANSWENANDIFEKMLLPYLKALSGNFLISLLGDSLQQKGDLVGSFALEKLCKAIKSKEDIDFDALTEALERMDQEEVATMIQSLQ